MTDIHRLLLYLQMRLSKYLEAKEEAKTMLDSGQVKTVPQLLLVVEKTPFSKDAKTTPERFDRCLENMSLFRLGDIHNMAQALDVDDKVILDIFYNEFLKQLRKKKV